MGGKVDQAKGRTKEALGDLKDDDELKREGQRDQTAGRMKEEIDDAGDWVEEKVDELKEKANRH
jgi:uncharacterized protein YjbJ (UPF0337 family)